ncbi:hypothetical protein GCM10025331_10680 [Actinoplanes utahensis]|nr:hypothetical protein Aut01nite_17920 [Actinoplanes utahensis]
MAAAGLGDRSRAAVVVTGARERAPDLRETLERIVAGLPSPRVHLSIGDDVRSDEVRTATLVRCVPEVVRRGRPRRPRSRRRRDRRPARLTGLAGCATARRRAWPSRRHPVSALLAL